MKFQILLTALVLTPVATQAQQPASDPTEAYIAAGFAAMDTDKNGCLNAAEYAHLTLIKNAGTSAPPMSLFDTEKNQCLDFKEYVTVVDYMLKHEHK